MDKVMFINIRGVKMSCLLLAGEPRLLVSQVVHNLTNDGFREDNILSTCVELQINFKRCSLQQLESLTTPMNAHSADHRKWYDLITKSDVERLCGVLFRKKSKGIVANHNDGLLVCHDCFGGCEGLFVAKLYVSPDSLCIECIFCHFMLSPSQFVIHSHNKSEDKLKHWGFSSTRWRSYVFTSQFSENEYREFEELKRKFLNDKTFKDDASRVEGAKNEIREIFDAISSQTTTNLPVHLCSDEPVLIDSNPIEDSSLKLNCVLQGTISECVPNVSLALFDHYGDSNSEINKCLKHPLQCHLKIVKGIVKHYLNSEHSLSKDSFNDVPFHELCKYEVVEKLLSFRKELFTLIISNVNFSNKQEFVQNFELMQKHGMELVYFLLGNKAEISQKLKMLNNMDASS